MPQSLSSTRIKRLNSLLTVLSRNSYITLEELLEKIKYPSVCALGRDLQFLRKAFNGLKPEEAADKAIDLFSRTRNNREFSDMVKKLKWF